MIPVSSSIKQFLLLILAALVLSACSGSSGGQDPLAVWLIPERDIQDGGPGIDGIPAIENPIFESAATITTVDPDDMVIALRYEGQVKVYPHDIMDYHEIVNDGSPDNPITLSYCPLTDSAVLWKGNAAHADPTYGTSGFLYNSNLIMYDRETLTFWSQMLQLAVNGPRIREVAKQLQIIETTFSTLQTMYPDALVMTRDTGHSREYDRYPYGAYTTSGFLLFQVRHLDTRLFPKHRIMGIYSDTSARAYQISGFGPSMKTINDQFENQSIVAVGNSDFKFAAIYNRQLSDGTILTFSPIQDDLPNIMTDTEGNVWDVFGMAVSGPRAGQQLGSTRSYKAMWFAWAAFFEDSDIFFN